MIKIREQLIKYHFLIIISIILLFPLLQSHPVRDFLTRQIIVENEIELREAIAQGNVSIAINDIVHLEDYVAIANDVTIGGSGVITVSDQHRHFIVEQDGNLTLRGNVTLTRSEGYTGNGGGIWVNAGTLIMRGGYITGNDWWFLPEDDDIRRGIIEAACELGTGNAVLCWKGACTFVQLCKFPTYSRNVILSGKDQPSARTETLDPKW